MLEWTHPQLKVCLLLAWKVFSNGHELS